MKRADFLHIVGKAQGAEYVPVAGILEGGYGFAGYFNAQLNEGLSETCVLLNVRLVSLGGQGDAAGRPTVSDFNQFVEEIVAKDYLPEQEPHAPRSDFYGQSIPLAAIAPDKILALYPVAAIGQMMQELQRERGSKLPSFLDFDEKSIILKVLRTKLW